MQPHPVADVFPPLDDKAIQELGDSIRESGGLRDPIVTLDDKILDGRGRFRACQNIGAQIQTVPYRGDDPVGYVISKNLHRRPLNESQRGLIAARLAQLTVGRPIAGIPAISQMTAAKLLGVSRDTVTCAKLVLTYGAPSNIAQIESGKLRLGIIARALRREHQKPDPDKSSKGKNPERIQRQKMKGQLWGRLRDALVELTSLPLASEVADLIRRNDKTGLVDQRLPRARRWLEDFAHAWEHGHGKQEGHAEDHPDPGKGDGASGGEHDQQAAE